MSDLTLHFGQPGAKTARCDRRQLLESPETEIPTRGRRRGVRKAEDERPVATRSVLTTGVGVTEHIPPLSVTRIR